MLNLTAPDTIKENKNIPLNKLDREISEMHTIDGMVKNHPLMRGNTEHQPNGENTVPIVKRRNERGLLIDQEYVFDEIGNINWRKMLRDEYIAPNRLRTEEKDVTKLEDKDLIILLSGIKHLARLRGFKSVTYRGLHASLDYCCVSCEIKWIGNYESDGLEQVFTDIGDAHVNNTTDFGQKYLGAMAANRAFVRAVRNYLNIHIVAADELGKITFEDSTITNAKPSPINILKDLMSIVDVDFEGVKKVLYTSMKFKGAEELKSLDDIPNPLVYQLIDRLHRKEEKLKKKG